MTRRTACRNRSWQRRLLGVGAALLTVLGGPPISLADEDLPRPPALERAFPQLREMLKDQPAFIRDTDLDLHFRMYYLDRAKPDGTYQEALAFGGWIDYRSGWFQDFFQIGASFYGSAPLYAPDDRDGTLLLKSEQKGYYVPGQAYGALKFQDYALLKGYRQEVVQTYINRQDNRMTPNTFEGVTLGGKLGPVEYLGAYLTQIKKRNADTFISMADAAGASGSNAGLAMIGFRLTPVTGLKIELSEQYGIDTFNTAFIQAEYSWPLSEGLMLQFGAQFTDQRAVGDKLAATSAFRSWVTQVGSGQVALKWGDLKVTSGFSVTASGNTIQTPWGSYPGYLSLIQEDFDRANEKAWLIGVAYNFSKLITPGLSGFFSAAFGTDAINPSTRAAAPDQREYDFTIDYNPPKGYLISPLTHNLWFRLRGLIFDQEGGDKLGYQVRFIINWDIPLL